jgi:hypothetical protein
VRVRRGTQELIGQRLSNGLENRGGYLIGNMRTGRPDFRFFSLGNSLACLFGLLTAPQQRALFRLVLHNREHLMGQMPMRICHPPLDQEEWRSRTGSDPKNWPGSYHNGGHWPSLLWFLGAAILLHEQLHPGADVLPAFSPDGTLLRWTAARGGDAGGRSAASQLWVSRLDVGAIEGDLAAPTAVDSGNAP